MKTNTDQRQAAIITGLSLILMTVVAGITMGLVFAPIFEMDVQKFTADLTTVKSSFLFGVIAWVIILLLDLIVSWSLYKYFRSSNIRKAKVMGILRLIYSLILLVAILQLFRANAELKGSSPDADRVYELIYSFQSIWQFGLIVFGFHLLTLASLVCKKKTIRQVISILLFVAGIGYIVSNTLDLFITDYEQMRAKVEAVFILPMMLGEFGLAVWLLVKGGREAISTEKQFASGSC